MEAKPRQDGRWLLDTARAVAKAMMSRTDGTSLRIKIPKEEGLSNGDGWMAVIGDLGKNQPRLQIWYDRFSGYDDRKLCACFYSEDEKAIKFITKHVGTRLGPKRFVTAEDIESEDYVVLLNRLGRFEFNVPIQETHDDGRSYYGIYDPTRPSSERINRHFCYRAAAFFEDVARTLPDASAAEENREIYPRCENRKLVSAHFRRERSGYLATECKIRDGYSCQVCGFKFQDLYGSLGRDFAEAHHLTPLSELESEVRSCVEDLTTVCANCHRMLHRMDSHRGDVAKLRAIVRRRLEKLA